jgi:hypothetical protein|tara:strand:- start:3100 stop:3876 length:777 start_codon:yes stop_codon:yes gene_type:complete
MAEEASVFDATTQEPENTPEAQAALQNLTLADWVGEGKKYATEEEFVKAFSHSQAHIITVEKSYGDLKSDLDKRLTVEELVTKLQTPQTTPSPAGESSETTETTTPGPSTDELAELVNTTVDARIGDFTKEQLEVANETTVSREMRTRFGSDQSVATVLQAKAKEVGLSIADLQNIAKQNPKVFLSMFPVGSGSGSTQTTSSVNTDGEQFTTDKKSTRNFTYYEDLRKNNSREYWKPRVQVQMAKDLAQANAENKDFF